MGLRHMYGEIELKRVSDPFQLLAVCDVNASSAEHVAGVAEDGLGRRPRVYASFDALLEAEKDLDAVDIVTDAGHHHALALKAFDAGKHVAVEKPMGLTVRACHRMIEAAERAGRVLSVSENHRRDPINRLAKAVIDSGVLGAPRLMLRVTARGTRHMFHATAWRHMKLRGGYLLDYGAHDTDLLQYFMGQVERVYAETHLWERVRQTGTERVSPIVAKYSGHRVTEDIERGEHVECTSEDMALALIRFKSGATAQFASTIAAPGESTSAEIIYCRDGSVKLPSGRSGNPCAVTMIDARSPLSHEEVLDLVPGFQLDDLTASFFDGKRRLSSYAATPETDGKFIAMGLQDFANAIVGGSEPEVSGAVGLNAVALVYAILESGHAQAPVSLDDVLEDRVDAYQREINESAGL